MVRHGLTVLGLLLIAAGALWALQGSGVVMWPAESFMLRQESWVTYGLVTAFVGVFMVAFARRGR
jgi:hypothetical protein